MDNSPYYYSNDDEVLEDLLEASVASLDIDLRNVNCLEAAGITTIRQLLSHSREKLLEIKNFGERALSQVMQALQRKGFRRRSSVEAAQLPLAEVVAHALEIAKQLKEMVRKRDTRNHVKRLITLLDKRRLPT